MVQFKLLSGVLWEIEWDQTDPLRCLALLTKACFVSLTCGFILHVNAGQNGTDDNNAVDQAKAGRTTRAWEAHDHPSKRAALKLCALRAVVIEQDEEFGVGMGTKCLLSRAVQPRTENNRNMSVTQVRLTDDKNPVLLRVDRHERRYQSRRPPRSESRLHLSQALFGR